MLSKKGGIKIVVLFVLIIALALGTLLYLRSLYQKPAGQVTVEVKKPSKGFAVVELTPEQKKTADNNALGQALLSGNAADCEKITWDAELKKQCLDAANFADILRSGDEKQCEKLNDEKLKQECYDKIYYASAKDTMDLALCDKISDAALKQNCKDTIQAVLGRTAKSAADCDSIVDPAIKQNCRDSFYFESSVDGLQEAGCSNIADAATKDRCVKTIAQNKEVVASVQKQAVREYVSNTEILAGCDKLAAENKALCADEANFNLALEKRDLSYCDKISDTTLKSRCKTEQASNLNRFYLRQAIAMKNPTLCNKITDAETRASCLASAQ